LRDSRQMEAAAHDTKRQSNAFVQFLPVIALDSVLNSQFISRSIQRCLRRKSRRLNLRRSEAEARTPIGPLRLRFPESNFCHHFIQSRQYPELPAVLFAARSQLTDCFSKISSTIRSRLDDLTHIIHNTEPSKSRPVRFPASTSKYSQHGRQREQIPSSQP